HGTPFYPAAAVLKRATIKAAPAPRTRAGAPACDWDRVPGGRGRRSGSAAREAVARDPAAGTATLFPPSYDVPSVPIRATGTAWRCPRLLRKAVPVVAQAYRAER